MRKIIIMLMMLAMVLMISLTATASDDLQGLQKVPAGYFISEDVANGIIEKYPELEQIFENAMKVAPGSYMSDQVTTKLGNKINEVKADRDKWKEKYQVTYEALQEERQAVTEMKKADNKVIEIQETQIKSWKERYQKAQFQNTLEKAGLAVIIALFAANN